MTSLLSSLIQSFSEGLHSFSLLWAGLFRSYLSFKWPAVYTFTTFIFQFLIIIFNWFTCLLDFPPLNFVRAENSLSFSAPGMESRLSVCWINEWVNEWIYDSGRVAVSMFFKVSYYIIPIDSINESRISYTTLFHRKMIRMVCLILPCLATCWWRLPVKV